MAPCTCTMHAYLGFCGLHACMPLPALSVLSALASHNNMVARRLHVQLSCTQPLLSASSLLGFDLQVCLQKNISASLLR